MTPGFLETKPPATAAGEPSSASGSASMSARSRVHGPGPAPPRMSPTTPVRPTRSTISATPTSRSAAATNLAVSTSSKDSSGCACRCRRHATMRARRGETSGRIVIVGGKSAGDHPAWPAGILGWSREREGDAREAATPLDERNAAQVRSGDARAATAPLDAQTPLEGERDTRARRVPIECGRCAVTRETCARRCRSARSRAAPECVEELCDQVWW